MIRVHIHRRSGAEVSTANKALGFVLLAVGLACVVLLLLGLWILVAFALTAMAVVALVRAMLPKSRARERKVDGHEIVEGQSTTLHDLDDVGGNESSSSPFFDSKLTRHCRAHAQPEATVLEKPRVLRK